MAARACIVLALAACSAALGCSSRDPAAPDAGPFEGPTLAAMAITAADGGYVEVVPAFGPTVFDYYVRCASGTNELEVSLTAAGAALAGLQSPTATPAAAKQRLAVGVKEGDAIVAVATKGAASTEYWVRCLPHDFPEMQLTLHPEAGAPTPGYYLLGTSDPRGGARGYAMVLDGAGVPVWYAQGSSAVGLEDVDVVVPGAISFMPLGMVPWEIFALDPAKTSSTGPAGDELDPHELRVLPNGHYLVISYPLKSGVDLTGVSLPLLDGGTAHLGASSDITDCDLVEFEPGTGEPVWTWRGSEHFVAREVTVAPQNAWRAGPDGGVVVDPFHCNSIDVDPASGNLLVSARAMDSIFYVDRSTGKVLWKMGGVAQSNDDATYVPVDDPFYRQHDARLEPGWGGSCGGQGRVSLFDDHSFVAGPARGVEYDVMVGAGTSDEGCGSPGATLAWQYEGKRSSDDMGSFRISPDGSRVIGWGFVDGSHAAFSEVDDQGDDLLDFTFTDGDSSYRAIKAPKGFFDLEVLRRTSGVTP